MNTVELRQQIEQYLEQLSVDRLKTAAKVLAYLAEQEDNDETQELIDIPGFVESFERGKKDIEAGHVVDWRTIGA